MEHRELFGILGKLDNTSEELSWWNAEFRRREMDAAMVRYPTEEGELPERLSEMFHFDRRGYIVGKGLEKAIIPLLDSLDASAVEEGSVDTVLNDHGNMVGFYCRSSSKKRQEIFFV